jgi:hypothetical protein
VHPGGNEVEAENGDGLQVFYCSQARPGDRQMTKPEMIKRDPLIDAVLAYQAGMRAYNHLPENDEGAEFAELTYEPGMRLLENWPNPAQSHEGAIAALRAAQAEMQDNEAPLLAKTMVNAALAFFEGEGAQ